MFAVTASVGVAEPTAAVTASTVATASVAASAVAAAAVATAAVATATVATAKPAAWPPCAVRGVPLVPHQRAAEAWQCWVPIGVVESWLQLWAPRKRK